MTAKIAAFIITLIINVAAGIVVLFAMLLAMNGYSESDATYGIVAFIVLAIFVSLLMATLAVFVVQVLIKRQFRAVVSAIIAVCAFSVIGVVLKSVCGMIGIGVTEFVRVNYR
jgi:hypothetical protein